MKVGLIQVGGVLPNVALMRLSTYHKAAGDEVILNPGPLDQPDVVYISTIFTWLRAKVENLAAAFPASDVQIGGSGWSMGLRLPPEVDACRNDYDLYGIDYGVGYSSRGCIRTCAFCPVPRMEGGIREESAITALLNHRSNKLALLDNNFFASDWRPKVEEIRARRLVVDWPQGNDIRLMTEEIAAALGDLRTRRQISGDFKNPRTLHFAWDLPANDARTEDVVAGIKLLFAAGFKPGELRFFTLIGYPGYQVEEELHRIETLHGLDIEPYVMVYRDYSEASDRDPTRMDIQHWNNSHAWHNVTFAEYNRRFQSGRHIEERTTQPLPL